MDSNCITSGCSVQRTQRRPIRFCVIIFALLCICSPMQAEWQVSQGPLMTQWSGQVTSKKVHPEYPRPQQVRKNWLNLNGLWEYAIRSKEQRQPVQFDGQILVPFPIESALSGVMQPVGEENRLWYRRTFDVPKKWNSQRLLLHFGAVDWDSTIWVNGTKVGSHKGGYDPFTLDITDVLNDISAQEVVLSVCSL